MRLERSKSMIVFLICMIPVSGFIGFLLCAMLHAASDADRQDEKLFAEWDQARKDGDS